MRHTVATELTEGPFYFDVDSIRSDLREDREGTLLRLGIRVRDAGSCEPVENAVVRSTSRRREAPPNIRRR